MRIIDGIELLKEIKEGKLNSRDKFYVKNDINPNVFFVSSDIYRQLWMFKEERENIFKLRTVDSEDFINNKFIIEDNTEEIEEIPEECIEDCTDRNYAYLATKYNELVKAIKEIRKDLNK